MRCAKILVVLCFLSFGLVFWGQDRLSSAASQAGGDQLIDPPPGVTASDGAYSNSVGIYWNASRGAALYRVFRNTVNSTAGAADIGSTAANYLFDTTAVAGQTYYYWVRAENGAQISDFGTPDQGLRAVGTMVSGVFSPLPPPTAPAANQVTAAKAALGKALFWDEQLSSTATVSCGTCHRPAEGGADPRTVIGDQRSRHPGRDGLFNTPDDVFGSPGVPANNLDGTYSRSPLFGFNEQVTGRKAPSYLNAAYTRNGLFWDGRALDAFRDPLNNSILLAGNAGLESQSVSPPLSGAEMAHADRDWVQVAIGIAKAKPLALASNVPPSLQNWIAGRSYAELFQEAFGSPDVTPARIAMAIATHERTLFSDHTPFDRWAWGIEELTPAESRGRELFVTMQCAFCHGGPVFADQNYHNIGVRPIADDPGRGAISGDPGDNGRFRTPTLRNVELRAPYMHNGRIATLEEVIDFYNRGGDFDAPNINRSLIRPLGMSPEEKADLVAFMKRPMTDLRVRDELPPFDRPQLYTESTRVPVVSGTGRAGSGGIVPTIIAVEPPFVGNPSFTVAVTSGLGGAQAVLVIGDTDPGVGSSVPQSGSLARKSVILSGTGDGSVSVRIPNRTALSGRQFFGRWYVVDPSAANSFAVSRLITFTVFGSNNPVLNKANADFDGDGLTDLSVFRPAQGGWYIVGSSGGIAAFEYGASGDRLVPADYDGDGRSDPAVYRGDTWYIRQTLSGYRVIQFGQAGDIPQPADYDGDNKVDPAVFRPSNGTWYILGSSGGYRVQNFGATGDQPVAADYDGDGRADPAVYRGGTWFFSMSTRGFVVRSFGAAGDRPVVGDYDADGESDLAVWRPTTGIWYYINSGDQTFFYRQWGESGDVPSPGDYDGDGKTDFAVLRGGSTWFIIRSGTNSLAVLNWGAPGDTSVPSSVVP